MRFKKSNIRAPLSFFLLLRFFQFLRQGESRLLRNSRGEEETSEEMLEAECRDFLPLLVKEHAARSFLIQRN